ncbi:complement C1q-like protein 2, partial [Engraulis encrasicolus]|uniref:complement C1q-like protein 2 n=1 Tax=Engraulis encrasicolus TaxID=184585 RepID=UPI002FD58542
QAQLIKQLQEKQKEQEGVVEALGGKMSTTGSQVEELRRAQAVERVSFSASLQVSGHGPHIGPLNPPPILAYKHVITNIGNHYNPNTGIFTAPVRGVFHFLVFVYGGAGRGTGVSLNKNGDPIVNAYSHPAGGTVSSSNGASLLLEVGDVVYVKLGHGAWVYDSVNHHTTFSGHLLFPM